MAKNIIKIATIATLVVGYMNMAQAAPVTVTVNGIVSAVTCDLGVDAAEITLPAISPADFQTGAGTIAPKSQTDFKILTNNCAGTVTEGTGQGALKITGPFTSSGTQYFSQDASPNYAVGVMQKGKTVLLHNNDLVNIGAAGDKLEKIDNVTTEFSVAMVNASSGKPTRAGSVVAPITFTFVYN